MEFHKDVLEFMESALAAREQMETERRSA